MTGIFRRFFRVFLLDKTHPSQVAFRSSKDDDADPLGVA